MVVGVADLNKFHAWPVSFYQVPDSVSGADRERKKRTKGFEMKKFFIVLLVAVLFGFGCGDDDTVINEIPKNTTDQETVVAPDGVACEKRNIRLMACTSARQDGNGFLDSEPYEVADRIYIYSQAAVDDCFLYEDVSYYYGLAMKYINSGSDPNETEAWFRRIMRNIVGYNPA